MSDQTNSTRATSTNTDILSCRKELGERLRSAREKAGMTPDAIAQITRITRTYVTALESGEFHRLPGAVFGRGFVRSIARVLELDGDELVNLYAKCWDSSELEAPVKAPVAEGVISRRMAPRRSIGSGLRALMDNNPVANFKPGNGKSVAFLVSVPLVALALASVTAGIKRSKKAPVTEVTQTVENPVPQQEQPVTAPAQAAPGNPPTEASASAPKATSGEEPMEVQSEKGNFEHVLELVVIEPVKIKLTSDNNQPSTKQLKPDAYRFTFSDRAELTVYDAAAVELAFNGRSLGSLGSKGRIRRLIFQSGTPESREGGQAQSDLVGKTEKKL